MKEIEMNLELMEKKKVLIGTPMYGGVAHCDYITSMLDLFRESTNNKIEFELYTQISESLITRGRNNIVDHFLNSDFDYLFFIDADIQFYPLDAIYMIYLAATTDKDIITATYPLKTINWDSIDMAQSLNLIKNEQDYESFSGLYVTHFAKNEVVELFDPIESLESGTGFMLIKRSVFEKFKNAYPEQRYLDEETEKEKVAYFDCVIDKDTKRYLSEDYMFCNYVTKLGIKIWSLPWIQLKHIGQYKYSGLFNSFLSMNYEIFKKNNK
jgi:hypothetical protein